MKITLDQLKNLLHEQKRLVVKRLKADSYLYNPKTTAGQSYTLELKWDKFEEIGMKSPYPDDIEVLSKYNIEK